MSAAELRKAAETLRKLVGEVAPWAGDDRTATWAETYDAAACEREHGYYNHDSAYIATMHPGVGLALADLLDHEAKLADSYGPGHFLSKFRGGIDALAVARLINGTSDVAGATPAQPDGGV